MRAVIIKVPGGQFLAAGKPNVFVRSSVFDELTERADAMRLADNVRVESNIHDAAGFRALGVKLVKA